MRWPWVSRRAYDLVVEQVERMAVERDAYLHRGDRLYDETILRFGYEPATPRVREEMKTEAIAAASDLALDDPFGGTLDEELEQSVDAAVTSQQPS